MDTANLEDIYELSPLQQGLLFHTIYAPQSGVYFEQFTWTLQGDFNVAAFKIAWQKVVDRHPILRTAFYWQELEKPYQVVYQQVEIPWNLQDWREFSAEIQQQKLQAFLQSDRQQGFELSQAPLIRLNLFRLNENTYEFVWSSHHLLLDGWSESIVLKEVYALYQAFCQGKNLNLKRSRPYRDYIAWLQQQDLAQAEAFWRKTLKGFSKPTTLLIDRAPGILPSLDEDYDWQRTELSTETTTALQSLARQHQLTLNTFAQGAWALLLSRYSGESDIVFGSTSSGRPPALTGVEDMVGLFVNTLPLRVQVRSDALLLPWLQELQAHQIEVIQYEYSPLVKVQRWSEVNRGQSLFEIGYVLENYPIDGAMPAATSPTNAQVVDSLKIQSGQSFEKTNEALSLSVAPNEALRLDLWYDTRRFDQPTIARMLGHLKTLLTGMVANPTARLSELPLLTPAEQQQLLVFSHQSVTFPELCIHNLFEQQASRTPDAIAVVFGDQTLTYTQLHQKVNHLAQKLATLGVAPGVLVGICIERSLDMVIAPLAVLKAGGAYVPLDPAYPDERLAFMLEDAQVQVLLTQTKLLESLPANNLQVLCLDTDWQVTPAELSPVHPSDLAYVIYTSGSTGKSKGVMVQHSSLVNAFYAWEAAYQLTSSTSSHLQMASFAFDVCTGDFIRALCSGGKLVLCPREFLLEPQKLYELMVQEKVDCAEFVPAVLRNLMQYLQQSGQRLDFMQLLICGSDSWYGSEYMSFRSLCGSHTRLINSFGVTEATIDSCYFETTGDLPRERLVPIGRPFANTQLYILDSHLQPLPIGVPGELYIGGAGVAQGYLNRPELTAEKFIDHPFNNQAGERLYKTGDLACWLADGNIEFLGRIDYQTKIRGYRIELGEIEATLNQHPGVKTTAVVASGDSQGEKRLVAYVVQNSQYQGKLAHKTTPQLRQYLKSKLPEYMVPSAFILLNALPLTPNGKLDRRSLPEPDLGKSEPVSKDVVAQTPIQEIVKGIWSQVLGVKYIGIHDNFFDLGGHSLLATQVISRVREAFEIDLPLRCLFESPTIADLSASIEVEIKTQQGLQVPPLLPVSRDANLPLSFAQQRLWLMCQLVANSDFYNDTEVIKVTGQLNIAALEQSINEIVRRHEALRTTFPIVQGQAKIAIAPTLTINLPVVDLRELDQQQRQAKAIEIATQEAKQPFDLTQGPLLRVKLLWLDSTEYILLLNQHHIISDGWSMGVWLEELTALYEAYCAGKVSPLPELSIQYVDFAVWQRQWLQGAELDKQLNYWRKQLGQNLTPLQLPTDKPRPAQLTYQGKKESFLLPLDLTKQLQVLSQQERVTLFMTLLAAFKTLLYCYSGQADISVGSPIANRNRSELEKLIGCFINTLVLRTDLSDNPSFRELLGRIREVTLGAYAHQDLPFEKIVEELQPERYQNHLPLFQVWFVLQNTPLGSLKLPNLTLEPLDIDQGIARYDLGLFLVETSAGISGCFEYSTDLFLADTITRMVANFQSLLNQIATTPDIKLDVIVANFNQAEKAQKIVKAKELEATNLQMLKNIKRQSVPRS